MNFYFILIFFLPIQVSVCTKVWPTCKARNGTMDVITHVLAMTQSMEDTNVILSKLLCSKWKNITTTVPVYTSEFEAMYLLKKIFFFFIV